MKLRDYQIEIVDKGSYILKRLNIVYLSMEVRTGKTLVSFSIAEKLKFKNVLFITKKKAIENIKDDYNKMSFSFDITIINNESLHTIDRKDFDLLISDEHHRCFLGNTLIDGEKISDIVVGTSKKSYNFASGKYEYKKVVKVHKNKLRSNLIKIKCNGKEIVCTEEHEIFTKRGWVEARNLLPTDELQVV